MKLIKTHAALLVWRIILLYVVMMLCRAVFYAYNSTLIGELPYEELWSLLCGSLKFDTVSIIYANAIFSAVGGKECSIGIMWWSIRC